MRFTIELDETDAIAIRVALRQRANALHNLADELIAREPGEQAWKLYRQRGNELSALAERIGAAELRQHDTDISALISAPSLPPPSGESQ